MTALERLLEAYPGTHVAYWQGRPSWSLYRVDLEKRTAYVVNGNWYLLWDDTDVYCRDRPDGFLEWMAETRGAFEIKESGVELTWPDQRNELKRALPSGVENKDCSVSS